MTLIFQESKTCSIILVRLTEIIVSEARIISLSILKHKTVCGKAKVILIAKISGLDICSRCHFIIMLLPATN